MYESLQLSTQGKYLFFIQGPANQARKFLINAKLITENIFTRNKSNASLSYMLDNVKEGV